MTPTRGGLAAAALLALATTACWPQPGGNPEGHNYNGLETDLTLADVPTLAADWSAPGSVTAELGGAVGIDGYFIRALDPDTGGQLWRAQIPSSVPGFDYEVTSPPAMSGTDEISLAYRYSVFDGPGGGVRTTYVSARLDRATGAFRGILGSLDVPFGPETVNVVPRDDVIVFETATGVLRAVSATETEPTPNIPSLERSTQLWSAPSGTRTVRPVIANSPVHASDQLLDADGSVLRAFAPAGCGAPTCAPVWTLDLGAPISALAAGPGLAVVAVTEPTATGPAMLHGIARGGAGIAIWHASLPGPATSLAVAGDVVYTAAGSTVAAWSLYGCSVADCPALWSGSLPAAASGNLAAAADVLVAGAVDGSVTAFPLAGCGAPTCAPAGAVRVAGPPTTLLVSAGHLFVTAVPPAGPETVTAFVPTV